MSDCPVSVGDVLADKYRVERILGQGGMGVVVAAWHIELEQRVAVKFLLPQYAEDKSAAERFRREARAAVKIRNEHVARVIDVGMLDGRAPYMVMEYLDGHDLQTELDRVGCFEIPEAVDYVLQACVAMAEAHVKGMVHRDLKPANLFRTTRADGSKVIKVLDFGISKSLHGGSDPALSLTRTASMIGSPLYMSPEQLESARDVDERADVWSLGVILFELMTGSVPFSGDSLPQLVRAVLSGAHTKAHELRPGVPVALSEAIANCLRIDKAERLANVAELARALSPYAPNGTEYSERIDRVFALSALPTAPTAPIPLDSVNALAGGGKAPGKTLVAAGSGSHGVQAVSSGSDSRERGFERSPSTGRGGTIDIHVADGSSDAPPAPADTSTVASWGKTGGSGSRPGVGWVVAVAALLVGGGVVLWTTLDASAPTAEGSVLPAGEAVGEVRAADEVKSVSGAAAMPGSDEANPAVAPAEPMAQPTAEATALGASAEAERRPTVEVAAEPRHAPDPVSSASTEVRKPLPRKPSKAAPPSPSTQPSAGKSKSDFTDFGGRR